MTQLHKVLIDGMSVTDKVQSCNLSSNLGSIFNTAVITIATTDVSLYINKDIVIQHGDDVFNGFVFSYQRGTLGTFNLNIRSNGGKLSEPFFTDTEGLASATSSTALCAEYSGESGVSISYNTVEVPFGGSWVESGTPDTELLKLASVTGADIYDDGVGIIIEPVKAVSGTSITVNTGDILDFNAVGKSIDNNGLGIVITKTSSSVVSGDDITDVISRPKLSVDIDESTGYVKVYPVPNGALDSYTGISLLRSNVYDELSKSIMLNSGLIVELDGAISSIKSVTLNGVAISHYKYAVDTATVYFDTPQSGLLTVEYATSYHYMQLRTTTTPSGEFAHFTLTKGTEFFEWSGFVESIGSVGTDGVFDYTVVGDNHVDGVQVYVFGDIPDLTLYSGAEVLPSTGNITVTPSVSFTMLERGDLLLLPDGSYAVYTKHPINTVIDVTSGGVPIVYTTPIDGDGIMYIGLPQWYPDVEVAYTALSTKVDIVYPDTGTGFDQTLVLSDADEIYEITITPDEQEWYDPSNFPCGYPADFPLNIAQLFSLPIDEVSGVIIPTMGTVDSLGFVYVHIIQDGIYEYDTSIISDRTTLTIKANTDRTL